MNNFSTDEDLLKLEPELFQEITPVRQTFDPEHEEARWLLMVRFGLELDSANSARWIRRHQDRLRRASTAAVLAKVYRGQAAQDMAAASRHRAAIAYSKADRYTHLYEVEISAHPIDWC